MAKKKYRVEVCFEGERFVTVSANNERSAKAEAHRRVAGKKIQHSDIRKDWTDADEV